jgi:hypothetical protein
MVSLRVFERKSTIDFVCFSLDVTSNHATLRIATEYLTFAIHDDTWRVLYFKVTKTKQKICLYLHKNKKE